MYNNIPTYFGIVRKYIYIGFFLFFFFCFFSTLKLRTRIRKCKEEQFPYMVILMERFG